MNPFDRRSFLQLAGLAGAAQFAGAAENISHQVLAPDTPAASGAQPSLRFAVIGLDHYHIMSMTAAVLRGGGTLVSVLSTNTEGLKDKQLADFRAQFGNVPEAASEDAILQDRSIALVLAAPIPEIGRAHV